jgi:hypothetical protein
MPVALVVAGFEPLHSSPSLSQTFSPFGATSRTGTVPQHPARRVGSRLLSRSPNASRRFRNGSCAHGPRLGAERVDCAHAEAGGAALGQREAGYCGRLNRGLAEDSIRGDPIRDPTARGTRSVQQPNPPGGSSYLFAADAGWRITMLLSRYLDAAPWLRRGVHVPSRRHVGSLRCVVPDHAERSRGHPERCWRRRCDWRAGRAVGDLRLTH